MSEGFVYSDGGRVEAGYKGNAGDCVCRAIAIAMDKPYKEVYTELSGYCKSNKTKGYNTCRDGVHKTIWEKYLKDNGWKWVPCMKFGEGVKVHLCSEELPKGRLIVQVSRHLCAMIDGVIYDTHDPRRYEETMMGFKGRPTRAVYGYYVKA